MTTECRPQSDPAETPDISGEDGDTDAATTPHPTLEQQEEEAARLGDFA